MAKLFRVKRRGRYIGSWRVVIKGREINLRTKDATTAGRRAQLAAKGLWPEAGETNAADAVRDALEVEVSGGQGNGVGADAVGPVGGSIPPSTEGSAGGGHAPPPPAPLVPEVVTSQNWAEDAAGAATDGATSGTAETPGATTLDGIDLGPLYADAAKMLVELQLNMQAWTIRRWKNKQAPPLPDTFPLRAPAALLWEKQLRIWLPQELPIPPWGAAMLLGLSMGAVQLAAAQPIPKEGAGG